MSGCVISASFGGIACGWVLASALACGGVVSDPSHSAAGGSAGAAPVIIAGAGNGDLESDTRGPPCQLDSQPEIRDYYGCGRISRVAHWPRINLLLVIDVSASMAGSLNGETKWSIARQAIQRGLDDTQGVLDMGVLIYPASDSRADCLERCCTLPSSGVLDAPLQTGSEAVISDLLGQNEPGGGTPTAAALERAGEFFAAGAGSGPAGKNVILLVTDGGANCNPNLECAESPASCTYAVEGWCDQASTCCNDAPEGCHDQAAVEEQIRRLGNAGVDTLLFGVADHEEYATALSRLASLVTASTSYRESGLDGVRVLLRSLAKDLSRDCRLSLGPQGCPYPQALKVAVDCKLLDASDDAGTPSWTLSENSRALVFEGDVCAEIERYGALRVDVFCGCYLGP